MSPENDRRVWTASNLMTLARIVLVVPIVLLLLDTGSDRRLLVLSLVAAAALTDLADGYLARRLGQVTELGKIIDPTADKLAVGAVMVVLASQGRVPWWFLGAVLMRDALILSAGAYLRSRRGLTLQSNLAGKWAVTSIALYILAVIADYPQIEQLRNFLIIASLSLLSLSSALYLRRFISVLRAPGEPAAQPF